MADPLLSIVYGPTDEPLWTTTLGALIESQARLHGDRAAVVFPEQQVHRTYQELLLTSKIVAKAILRAGLQHGDSVGIMAGNCHEYIEMFLGASRIGCPVIVLNNTYTPTELQNAVIASRCKLLCVAQRIGPRLDLSEHLDLICSSTSLVRHLVLFNGSRRTSRGPSVISYSNLLASGKDSGISEVALSKAETTVRASDVLNLQFTSGTTGAPKAAMLTHLNLINNGRLNGERMQLTPEDVVCCPPPLFHCFGLVIGFLATFTHGSTMVFPSIQFDANRVLDAVASEQCTVLLGVPTMFIAEMEANRVKRLKITTLRMGLAAGSQVPQAVLRRLEEEMGIQTVLIAYGMTETSPVTFATSLGDSEEHRITTVGTVLAHTAAKIVDCEGHVVPRGVRGEICTSGYALQLGYFENESKTREAMLEDEHGVVWMSTGDEGVLDAEGYCSVTGRIKDIIIRGGENIFPVEIEERLLSHPCISEVSVVGLPDYRYGEAVACFVQQVGGTKRPDSGEVQDWVRQRLGKQKVPKHVFWIGEDGVGADFPKTGSGKHQKFILKDIGSRILARPRAKL